MKANAVPLLALFEKKIRFEIPLFQRQYVWSKELQWELLWEDISRKFSEYLEGRKDSPVHFLGAMVLDQKLTPSTHVERRQVIDGQQRLTTLQIFLAAFRDFCTSSELEELSKELKSYTTNSGMMADPKVDQFKVWPTQLDREYFSDVLSLGTREAVEAKYPLVKKKYQRTPEPRPLMIEAYLYFSDVIYEFFQGSEGYVPIAAERPLPTRVEECFQSLKNALQVVAIDLENDDDAQVIFETLNARGEPLLPADLLRNYIFLRVAKENGDQEKLYKEYWSGFDEEFWRLEVKQGRLNRPRSDLFMQHFLASKKAIDIPIKNLFVEYRHWIDREKPYTSIVDELQTIAKQRDNFRRLLEPKHGDYVLGIAMFAEDFDVRTIYPLLLFLLERNVTEPQWTSISGVIESYILRRFFTRGATNSYGRIFLSLIKALQKTEVTAENLRLALSKLAGETSNWPNDTQFEDAWRTLPAYGQLSNPKLVHVLKRLNDRVSTNKNESIVLTGQLTVEHIMPQKWVDEWPLPGGEKGFANSELDDADENDGRVIATRLRNTKLQTIGNLTLLTQPLNSSVSNSAWQVKKAEIAAHSFLPINIELQQESSWSEKEITNRCDRLFQIAKEIWPGPSVSIS